jgi:hypothetical protein
MSKERDDFSGPLAEYSTPWEEFSKEFLLKLMKIWQDHWDAFMNQFMVIGSQIEGIGTDKALDFQLRLLEAITPSTMARIAELAKIDTSTVAGRCKVGMLSMDQIAENYPGRWEVKSDDEVLLTYDRCKVFETVRQIGSLELLHKACLEVEPRYAEAFQNYPDDPKKVKVTMLKVPESFDPPPEGEPLCLWKFAFHQ